jgi:hypothetical protein
VVLVAFAILALVGLPGAGLILVPIGFGMVIGRGIPNLLDRIAKTRVPQTQIMPSLAAHTIDASSAKSATTPSRSTAVEGASTWCINTGAGPTVI